MRYPTMINLPDLRLCSAVYVTTNFHKTSAGPDLYHLDDRRIKLQLFVDDLKRGMYLTVGLGGGECYEFHWICPRENCYQHRPLMHARFDTSHVVDDDSSISWESLSEPDDYNS